MFTVALIGPDGAGKTTLARRLERELPVPAKYLYMGVNADASNHLLPTTRLVRAAKRTLGVASQAGGPPPLVEARASREGPPKRVLRSLKRGARLMNQLAEEWYRHLIAVRHVRDGRIVLFDRHFYSDYYAHDVSGPGRKALSSRIHGYVLRRLYPQPDLVVLLDAPVEVLWARKQEGTKAALERRRREYQDLVSLLPNLAIVDASRSTDDVTREVTRLILEHARRRAAKAAAAAG